MPAPLPFPDRNAQYRSGAIRMISLEDGPAHFLVHGMNGQHRVGSTGDGRLIDAQPFQLLQRTLIPDRNQIHMVSQIAHGLFGHPADDGADALSVKHDLRPEQTSQHDNEHIIVETAAAGNIL